MKSAPLALLVLTACSGGLPVEPSGVRFTPDAGGLAVYGTDLRIDFGRAPEGVIAALDRELGRGRDMPGCAGLAERAWGGLTLNFTDERFVGWQEGGASAGRTCRP